MGELLKNFDRFMIVDFMPSYLKKKVPDCTLYSGDGHQFQIHKVGNYFFSNVLGSYVIDLDHR